MTTPLDAKRTSRPESVCPWRRNLGVNALGFLSQQRLVDDPRPEPRRSSKPAQQCFASIWPVFVRSARREKIRLAVHGLALGHCIDLISF